MIGKAKVTFSWVSELVGDEEGSKDFYIRLSPRIKEGAVQFSHEELVRLGVIVTSKICEKSTGLKDIKLKANK